MCCFLGFWKGQAMVNSHQIFFYCCLNKMYEISRNFLLWKYDKKLEEIIPM